MTTTVSVESSEYSTSLSVCENGMLENGPPSSSTQKMSLVELVLGISYGFYYSRKHLINSYVLIPIGVIVLFTILYGLNQLLANVFKIRFPASVLGMLINLVVLSVLNLVSLMGESRQKQSTTMVKISSGASWLLTGYLTLIKPSMNFSLKWINVFFIPSFIILPLSDPISFIECLKIAGVFVIGFLLLFCVDVYGILGLKWVLETWGVFSEDLVKNEDIELNSLRSGSSSPNTSITSMRDDITTIDISRLRTVQTENPQLNEDLQNDQQLRIVSENPFSTQDTSAATSIIHPILPQPEPIHHKANLFGRDPVHQVSKSPAVILSTQDSIDNSINVESEESVAESIIPPSKLSANTQKVVISVTNYIDWILYGLLFIISLPLYYITAIHTFLPYHLGMTILAYYLALFIPQKWPSTKKFAHPILILTAEILFVCFIGSLIYHHGEPKGFIQDLKYYKTGKNYLNLFNRETLTNNGKQTTLSVSDPTGTPQWPGCGDVLSSLMDISIVSLSLPMFTHRKDFIRNFWVLMPPILLSIGLTFFLYPIICHQIGIESARAIGFIGRSVTLALGTPLIGALDGSVSLMAVCTILSGICGVMVGDTLFRLLRVPQNDYVTRGVSLGINCGAIATAHLLNSDPRAASMSSLSFSIFGTVMVIMASISSVRDIIQSLAGL